MNLRRRKAIVGENGKVDTETSFTWSNPSVKEKRYLREREKDIGVFIFSNGTEEAV